MFLLCCIITEPGPVHVGLAGERRESGRGTGHPLHDLNGVSPSGVFVLLCVFIQECKCCA
ncbi:hypothetical protein E2C01_095418 [Portunus trituberculatus]|uniref:Uncharacterized protein n=1 Tax=Portunus trituberculatus TaxID=210409 RepID=A0A5B7JPS5_PORTR|nr:hypothetical protein [Portunus trituberculatus]